MPSSAPPRVFDRDLLRQRLDRALAADPPDFLLTRAAEDLADRLAAIKRDFPRALDLGTPTAHFAEAVAATGRPTPLRAAPSLASSAEKRWPSRRRGRGASALRATKLRSHRLGIFAPMG